MQRQICNRLVMAQMALCSVQVASLPTASPFQVQLLFLLLGNETRVVKTCRGPSCGAEDQVRNHSKMLTTKLIKIIEQLPAR